MVEDRVPGREYRVAFSLVGEDLHRTGLVEARQDGLFVHACLLHLVVAVRVTDRVAHDALTLLSVCVDEERFGAFELCVHLGLDHRLHLLLNGLLGVFLHPGVDRGVDLQTVAVDVVGRAVGFGILQAPAVDRIFVVLLDRLFVVPVVLELAALGPFGVHRQAEHLPEIGRRAFVVRDRLVVEQDRQGRDRIPLVACDGACRCHAVEHQVTACEGIFRVAAGGIHRGTLDQSRQQGGFLDVEFVGFLVEEGVGRRFDAVGVRAELHGIQVHGGDLLLGVVVFEFQGRDPLLEFGYDQLGRAGDLAPVLVDVAGKEVFG